jgi:hypothetical protein
MARSFFGQRRGFINIAINVEKAPGQGTCFATSAGKLM